MTKLANREHIMHKINERIDKGYGGLIIKSDEIFVSTIKYLTLAGFLIDLFSKETNTYIIKWN